jgi:hypothetical protein
MTRDERGALVNELLTTFDPENPSLERVVGKHRVRWYRKAADQGDAEARNILIDLPQACPTSSPNADQPLGMKIAFHSRVMARTL